MNFEQRLSLLYNVYIFSLLIYLCYTQNVGVTTKTKWTAFNSLSSVLTRITDNKTYDKRLRPYYGGPPTTVGVTVHIIKIGSVSEMEMDFTLDMNMRHTWNDPRLKWSNLTTTEVKITDQEYIRTLWVPGTCFPNEKRATYHRATVNQTFLRIKSSGTVSKHQNGYTTRDLVLLWKENVSAPVRLQDELNLPTFELSGLMLEENVFQLNSENYSRLHCKFKFERMLQFYWIQIYQPSIMVVMVSWVAFWINRDSAPARITLSISTVLAMTTLMSQTNQQLPKVSYVKAVDVYMVVCYILVIAALLEYAAVGYSNKKTQDLYRREMEGTPIAIDVDDGNLTDHSFSECDVDEENLKDYDTDTGDTKIPTEQKLPLTYEDGHYIVNTNGQEPPSSPTNSTEVGQVKKRFHQSVTYDQTVQALSSNVDKYSRIIFPIIFAVFNVIYWIYYLIVSEKLQIH